MVISRGKGRRGREEEGGGEEGRKRASREGPPLDEENFLCVHGEGAMSRYFLETRWESLWS